MMQNLRQNAWYLGDLVGVPIFVHWSAIILVLLVWNGPRQGMEMFLLQLIWLVMAILLHELGHGLTSRAFGGTGITITLWAMGGVCSSRRDHAHIGREIAIVAAGPAVSLVLSLTCYGVLKWMSVANPVWLGTQAAPSLLYLALWVGFSLNLTLFFFNMLPIFPMDGGQLVFYTALVVTRRQLLARQISLFLAVFGSLAFFLWRTGLFTILAAHGGVGDWLATLDFNDVFLAAILGLMLRSAFTYLY